VYKKNDKNVSKIDFCLKIAEIHLLKSLFFHQLTEA